MSASAFDPSVRRTAPDVHHPVGQHERKRVDASVHVAAGCVHDFLCDQHVRTSTPSSIAASIHLHGTRGSVIVCVCMTWQFDYQQKRHQNTTPGPQVAAKSTQPLMESSFFFWPNRRLRTGLNLTLRLRPSSAQPDDTCQAPRALESSKRQYRKRPRRSAAARHVNAGLRLPMALAPEPTPADA